MPKDKGPAQPAAVNLTPEQLAVIKDKLDRDLDVARTVKYQVNLKTRDDMRRAKADSLRLEIERSDESHTETIDHANKMISRLNTEYEESTEQYRDAVNGYLLTLDELQQFQIERFENAHAQFMEQLNVVNEEFTSERNLVMSKYKKEQGELGSLLKQIEIDIKEWVASEKHEWQGYQDEDKNKINEDKQTNKIQMEAVIEDLWSQFQTTLSEYNESTKERRSQYDVLKKRDADNSTVIGEQTKKIMKLQETISALKSQYTSNINDADVQSKNLRRKKELLSVHFQQMKRNMGSKRTDERKKLTELTVKGKQVLKSLEAYAKRATEIIRAAEQCARYETDEDRFYGRVMAEEREIDLKKEMEAVEKQITDDLQKESITTEVERRALLALNSRYSKVKLDCEHLEKQRKVLIEKNKTLKQELKHVLEGMAVSEPILQKDNCLFMVNGKSNVIARKESDTGPFNITEGSLKYKSVSKQGPSASATGPL